MKLYISGPMTGLPDFNRAAFHAEAARLRALGYTVYNPAEYAYSGEFTLRQAFAEYCTWICTEADAVVMLPGWERSKGATAERALALAIGIGVYDEIRP